MSFMPFTAGSGEALRLLADVGALKAPPWLAALASPHGGASAFGAAVRRSSGPLGPAAPSPRGGASAFGAAVRRSSGPLGPAAPSPRGGASALGAAVRRSSRGRHSGVATRDVVLDDLREVLRDGAAAHGHG